MNIAHDVFNFTVI